MVTLAEAVAEIERRRDREWETKLQTEPIVGRRGKLVGGNPDLHRACAIAVFNLNEALRILKKVDSW